MAFSLLVLPDDLVEVLMRLLYPLGLAYGVIVLWLQYISIEVAFILELSMDLLLFLYFVKKDCVLLLRYLITVV